MSNLTLTLQSQDGEQYVLYLGGHRGTVANWIGQRLPLGRPWARQAIVALAYAMGATAVPAAPYSDPDECVAYYQGHSAGFHDEPAHPGAHPDAYIKGYWEGKR